MQLDCFLESFIKHIKYTDYKVAVVFHTSGDHKLGYEKLINKFKENKHIFFFERSEIKHYFFKILPLLFNVRNLYRFLKYKFLRKNVDNFKFLVEEIIKETGSSYTMFSTDDTVYDNDFNLDLNILERIKNNPFQESYRLCLGTNIIEGGIAKYSIHGNYLSWKYYESKGITSWGYPFIVDGTIYDSNAILKIIQKLLYHMPGTLESFVNTLVDRKKYFGIGLSPIKSCLSNIWLNRVQTLGEHNSLNIDVDMLNTKYLEGFKINYIYKQPVENWGTIPEKVYLKNTLESIVLHDETLKDNNLIKKIIRNEYETKKE